MSKKNRGTVDSATIPEGTPLDGVPMTQTEAQQPKPKESKAARFQRLATRRVPNALKAMGYVRNLFMPSNYEWTEAQKSAVLSVLAAEMEAITQAANGTQKAALTWVLPS